MNEISKDIEMEIDIKNFEEVKKHLMVCLVNRESYSKKIKNAVWEPVADLAKVYMIHQKTSNYCLTTVVNEDMLKVWGTTKTELDEISIINTQNRFPAACYPLTEIIKEMVMDWGDDYNEDIVRSIEDKGSYDIYVLTNSCKQFGAGAILLPGVMKDVKKKIGDDVYILPSSKHELLLVPKSSPHSVKELETMVREVNDCEVSPQDFLSNSIYEINGSTQKLQLVKDRMRAQKDLGR